MQGIENSRPAHPAKNQPNENSRRPGTVGHPGKHLGQFKTAGIKPHPASQSLIGQQLNAMQSDTKGNAANTKTEQQPEDSALSITADHMNDMSDAFADQISFTSKMHAISTGLF